MRAIQVAAPDASLVLVDLPAPVAGPGEVVLQVAACGVCYRDLVDRQGRYPLLRFPATPGHEIAGVVLSCGEGVSHFAPGDRVVTLHRAPCGACAACRAGDDARCASDLSWYGHNTPGGYAEQVLADARSLVRVPAGLALADASFLNCTAAVALRGLRTHARLQPGERVLVTGASGGVGLHGAQVARALGAEVIAATSDPQKVDALAPFADRVLVSAPGELHKQAKGLGVEVVLDCVGAPTLNASLRSLRPGGRLVVLGNVDQERLSLNPGYLILNEISLHGSAISARRDLEDVLAWAAQGRLQPQRQASLPLEDAARAQETLAARGARGRLVLSPHGDAPGN